MDFAEQVWEQLLTLLLWFCLFGVPILLTIFHVSCLFVKKNTPRFQNFV